MVLCTFRELLAKKLRTESQRVFTAETQRAQRTTRESRELRAQRQRRAQRTAKRIKIGEEFRELQRD
jgi:hypothetical protein